MGVPSPTAAFTALGKYTLFEKIGEGYLGSVYRGFDQSLDRAVTVRILCEGIRWDQAIEEVFHRQCHAVASLSHPGIASVYDSGKDGQIHYIVMESLGGTSLQSLIARKPAMTAEAKVNLMIQVAEGLDYAHRNGILHRDLAPAKIHMTADGAAKIRDFAVAHTLRKHLPHPAIRWGAPIYLSPEQVQQQDCDPRSDVFSAATIFYELLTYRHPFYNTDGNKALDNILLKTEIPTFEMFPDEPPGIWPILKTCLEKNPKDRYQSMDEFANACRDFLKDLAEDTRLMLAELYAAISPLKIAAAQSHASENTAQLLKDIQGLLSGEKQPDYASLDRLMTALLEQYPVIRAAAGASLITDSTDMQLPPEEAKAAKEDVSFSAPLTAPAPAQVSSHPQQPLLDQEEQGKDVPFTQPSPDLPVPTPKETESDISEFFESSPAEVWDFADGLSFADKTPAAEEQNAKPPSEEPKPDLVLPLAACIQSPNILPETQPVPKAAPSPRYRRIRRPSYRSAAALLALLVITASAYIFWGSGASATMTNLWKSYAPSWRPIANAVAFLREKADGGTVRAAGAETPKPQDTNQIRLSSLENTNAPGQVLPAGSAGSIIIQPPQESIARISALINTGNLQLAGTEINQLQKSFPNSSRVSALRRQLQAKDSAAAQEQNLKEQEQLTAARRQREEDWKRQAAALYSGGKYSEAESVLNLWLAENPTNWDAHEFSARLGEIQRNIKAYSAAMAENRYQDALAAIGTAERMNPDDAYLGELRRQAEARKANARATLIVHRLGLKGVLFMDGRPISNDGEIVNENVPIGTHLLTIESGGSTVVSRRQEFLEGQRIVLVHDLDRQYLRSMAESDRDLLAQRKAMEEVRFFEVEHEHGVFRGSCRGTLAVDYLDIAFKPLSGYHGFRMPFKLLKITVSGRTVNLLNTADGSQFQSFKFRNEQSAEKFQQSWDELKAYARQVAENK